jgi:hypothetical protein
VTAGGVLLWGVCDHVVIAHPGQRPSRSTDDHRPQPEHTLVNVGAGSGACRRARVARRRQSGEHHRAPQTAPQPWHSNPSCSVGADAKSSVAEWGGSQSRGPTYHRVWLQKWVGMSVRAYFAAHPMSAVYVAVGVVVYVLLLVLFSRVTADRLNDWSEARAARRDARIEARREAKRARRAARRAAIREAKRAAAAVRPRRPLPAFSGQDDRTGRPLPAVEARQLASRLRAEGHNLMAIGRAVGRDRRTIRRWLAGP